MVQLIRSAPLLSSRYDLSAAEEHPVTLAMPDANGGATSEIRSYAAIPRGAENKLNAWRFLKILLSDEVQGNAEAIVAIAAAALLILPSSLGNGVNSLAGEVVDLYNVGVIIAEHLVLEPVRAPVVACAGRIELRRIFVAAERYADYLLHLSLCCEHLVVIRRVLIILEAAACHVGIRLLGRSET